MIVFQGCLAKKSVDLSPKKKKKNPKSVDFLDSFSTFLLLVASEVDKYLACTKDSKLPRILDFLAFLLSCFLALWHEAKS